MMADACLYLYISLALYIEVCRDSPRAETECLVTGPERTSKCRDVWVELEQLGESGVGWGNRLDGTEEQGDLTAGNGTRNEDSSPVMSALLSALTGRGATHSSLTFPLIIGLRANWPEATKAWGESGMRS